VQNFREGFWSVLVKKLVIFGVGDQARVLHQYFKHDSDYEVVAFSVHSDYLDGDSLSGLPVVPFESIESQYPPDLFAMHVGMAFGHVNKNRASVYEQCKQKGYELVNYLSSNAVITGDVHVGDNCVILEHVSVQPFAKIGNNVTIANGAVVGHDVTIGDHCFVAAHAVLTGRVEIGEFCFVGANGTFRNEVHVAPECVIGAGALIMRDTQEREVYVQGATEVSSTPSDMLSPFFGAPRR
jgi:sugar O-acyltransferase (sialic acid O-acetyltransferase NeuD family)